MTRRTAIAALGAGPLLAASSMKMSLSVRVAEAFDDKTRSTKTLDELIALAKSNGFDAMCMRASTAGVHTAAEVLREMRRKIDRAGLAVSMVTGDFAVPANNNQGPQCLRRIAPYLDLAQAFGADLI
ncbi:MAG: hypothetical protein HYR60_06745, partial [Acidobacteria bacterium]|nr:hypothetical protein [Acidobacteriota bacterium]